MKRLMTMLAVVLTAAGLRAQTVYVCHGQSYEQYAASEVDKMPYSDGGATLTICGTAYSVADIDSIVFTKPSIAQQSDTIYVDYAEGSATVTYCNDSLTVATDGADVTVTSTTYKYHVITAILSGASSAGSFTFDGSCQTVIVLNNLTLTGSTGAAVTVNTGKKTTIVVPDGTSSTLADATGGSQKACLYSKGNFQFSGGTGTLNVSGNTKHAISCKEEIEIKKTAGTINITGAVSDGFHCNDYFQMNGGTVSITGTGGDGIDPDDEGSVVIKGGTINIDVATDDTKGIKTDTLAAFTMTGGEVTLNVTSQSSHGVRCGTGSVISGGTITATLSGAGAKGIKAADDLTITGGTISITHSGTCVVADGDTAKAVCIKGDTGAMTITGGTLTLKATGAGGKCINTEGTLTLGTYTSTSLDDIDRQSLVINCTTTGATWGSTSGTGSQRGPRGDMVESDDGVKAKTIRAEGDITINNGYICCTTATDGSEGIESKSAITVNNGYIIQNCYDDCLNSGTTITINGGWVYCYSSGNDAIDSNYSGSGTAIAINGGVVFAMGTSSPEEGLDCDAGYIGVNGGYLFSAGGQQNSSPSVTAQQATAYVGSYSLSSSRYYTLVCGSSKLYTVKAPANMNQNYSIVTATGMTTGTSCYLYYGTSAPTSYSYVFDNGDDNCFWIAPSVTTAGTTSSWTQSSAFTSASSSGGRGGR